MERFLSGHSSCPGCAVALAVRFVLRAVPDDAVVVVAPSCIGPMMGPVPLSSVTVPVFHTAFETSAAAASGLARAYRARGEQATVVCLAGDGGTYDIGLQSLSSAGRFLLDFLTPAHGAEFLAMVLRETWTTVAIATAGLSLALLGAIPATLIVTERLSISRLGTGRMRPAADRPPYRSRNISSRMAFRLRTRIRQSEN